MRKASAIFQEIEERLSKDDYASTLPIYHPAKGRRKRMLRNNQQLTGEGINVPDQPLASTDRFNEYEEKNPLRPFPDAPSEVERPAETEIEPPGEIEIDPERELPHRDMPHPDEEEIPGGDPGPEVEDPDQLI